MAQHPLRCVSRVLEASALLPTFPSAWPCCYKLCDRTGISQAKHCVLKRPEEVILSREEGEALLERLERDALTAEDRRVLGKVLTFYFWLLFAMREAKLSLKRLKALVLGEKPKKPKPPKPPAAGGTAGGGSVGENDTQGSSSQGVRPSAAPSSSEKKSSPGHGRYGAEVYRAAKTVECRHEA
jgi:hypothetical protein